MMQDFFQDGGWITSRSIKSAIHGDGQHELGGGGRDRWTW